MERMEKSQRAESNVLRGKEGWIVGRAEGWSQRAKKTWHSEGPRRVGGGGGWAGRKFW